MASERDHIDLLVIAQAQNNAERLNSVLRNAGHAARLDWTADLEDCEAQLVKKRPDLIFCFLDVAAAELDEVAALRDRVAPGVPIVAVAKSPDESAIARTLQTGARDLVSPDHAARLIAVTLRELGVARTALQLAQAGHTLRAYQTRFESLLTESNDAIAFIQDGITISANPAFLQRFGFTDSAEVEGTPIMDLFEGGAQTRLKDAIRQTQKGQDAGELDLQGTSTTGAVVEAKATLRQVEVDGEACVELAIRAEIDTKEIEERLAEATRRDPLTGLYHRHYFVEVLTEELQRVEKDASRALLYIKPDKFGVVEERVGLLASDEVLRQLGEIVKTNLADSDLPARFGGNIYTAIVVRSAFKDIEAIAERIRAEVAKKVFEAGGASTPMTVSIGIADLTAPAKGPSGLIAFAQQAIDEARKAGGNRTKVWAPAEVDKEGRFTDAGWVKRITAALRENRFHLVYQGIASLQGDSTDMIDVLVRMVGDDGAEIMPAEFMPAAARNGLMVGVDRWIVANALRVAVERCRARPETSLFLRLSDQTLVDAGFGAFLAKGMHEVKLPAGAIVLQVAEKSASKYLKEVQALVETATNLGCGFTIEHFGVGHEPMRLLDYFKPGFVKIDGSFMQVIDRDEAKRAIVKAMIGTLKEKGIRTIAERVENANTMALLWQLGADYIQGNYVQEPEVIMADAGAAAQSQAKRK